MAPFTLGNNGGPVRDAKGRFLPGHPGGGGGAKAAKSRAFAELLRQVVTADDFRAVVAALVRAAKKGQPWAVRELLNRLLGRAPIARDVDTPRPTMPPLSEQYSVQVIREMLAASGNLGIRGIPISRPGMDEPPLPPAVGLDGGGGIG